MVKIMRPVQNLSLRKSLVLYIVLFVMFALALSIILLLYVKLSPIKSMKSTLILAKNTT